MTPSKRWYALMNRLLAGSECVTDDKGHTCWVWKGSHSGRGRGGGYARISVDGSTMAGHRVAWSLANGPIPKGKQIDHKCRNRLCVNPDHLEMVTQSENMKRIHRRESKP